MSLVTELKVLCPTATWDPVSMASTCLSLDENNKWNFKQDFKLSEQLELTAVFSFIRGSPVQRRPLLSTAEHLLRQTFRNLKVRKLASPRKEMRIRHTLLRVVQHCFARRFGWLSGRQKSCSVVQDQVQFLSPWEALGLPPRMHSSLGKLAETAGIQCVHIPVENTHGQSNLSFHYHLSNCPDSENFIPSVSFANSCW